MGMMEAGDKIVTVEACMRGGSLSSQDRPVGDLAVPIDQRRNRSASSNHDLEQFPHRVCDWSVVTVDEKQVPLVVGLFGMACEMNLPNAREGEVGQILKRREAKVGGGHEAVVDVGHQAASG